eukprot:10897728-Heterocapsa_arctica.AAC.1
MKHPTALYSTTWMFYSRMKNQPFLQHDLDALLANEELNRPAQNIPHSPRGRSNPSAQSDTILH